MLWLHLFSHDPEVVGRGITYLRIVAPAYSALGFGFVVAFAVQGTGHVLWPFVASVGRILVAAGLGWIAVGHFGAGMATLASMVAASLVAYAAICAIAMLSNKVWRKDKGLNGNHAARWASAVIGFLQRGDVEFRHFHHRRHRALRAFTVRTAKYPQHRRGNDLPGDTVTIL